MMKKVTVAALFLIFAVVPLALYAAGDDNAAPSSAANKSSLSGNPSYFEGVWVGRWPGFKGPGLYQDVTLIISRGAKEGVFIVQYSWEGGPAGSGFPISPGSVKTKGKEEGAQIVFEWQNKEGREQKITLNKHEDNKVKAKLEKSGPTRPGERPFNETILNRK